MNLKVEYLGEIKVIFETASGIESGDQVGSIWEKKTEVENHARQSLLGSLSFASNCVAKIVLDPRFCKTPE
jgi:hypothetical protein